MKRTLIYGLCVAALAITGCDNKEKEERAAAEALSAEIDQAMARGADSLAVELCDSLNRAYPLQLEVRRTTTGRRAKAMGNLARTRIPACEAQMAQIDQQLAELSAGLRLRQPSKALPGYYVSKSAGDNEPVQARLNTGDDAADTPWTLAADAGRNIGLTSLSVACADGSVFNMPAPMAVDGQLASINPEAAEHLAQHLADNPATKAVKVTFTGSKGKSNVKITAAQSDAIAQIGQIAKLKSQRRELAIEREKLERQLQIAADQTANLGN